MVPGRTLPRICRHKKPVASRSFFKQAGSHPGGSAVSCSVAVRRLNVTAALERDLGLGEEHQRYEGDEEESALPEQDQRDEYDHGQREAQYGLATVAQYQAPAVAGCQQAVDHRYEVDAVAARAAVAVGRVALGLVVGAVVVGVVVSHVCFSVSA